MRVGSGPEASGRLVGSPVFKTGGRRSASPAGSIPVRLRYLRRHLLPEAWRAPDAPLAAQERAAGTSGEYPFVIMASPSPHQVGDRLWCRPVCNSVVAWSSQTIRSPALLLGLPSTT